MFLIDAYNELMEKAQEEEDKDNFDEALKLYTKAINCSLEKSLSYYKRGEIYFSKGENKKSIFDYDKAIGIDPEYPIYYFSRAFSKFNLEDLEGAKYDFFISSSMGFKPAVNALKEYIFPNAQGLLDLESESILKNPSDIASYKRRASLNSQIDPLSAISDLTKVLEIDPSQVDIYLQRGAIRRRIGHDEEAFEDIEKFLEFKPNSIMGLANLGWLYVLNDQNTSALETFKKCCSFKAKNRFEAEHQVEVLEFLKENQIKEDEV